MTDDSKIPLGSPFDQFKSVLAGGCPANSLAIFCSSTSASKRNTFANIRDLLKLGIVLHLESEQHLPDPKEPDSVEKPKKNKPKGPQSHRKFGLVKKL